MRSLFHRCFDWSYLLLAPGVFLTFFVPIRFRFGPVVIIPFIGLWLLWVLLKNERGDSKVRSAFVKFMIPMTAFFLLRDFLVGWEEWDGNSLLRHLSYSAIVLFYDYLLYYTASHRKYKELLLLNSLIFLSLAYGTFSYMDFEMGSFRNQAGGEETIEQTYNRLERAFAGATNFGDAYAMVYAVIALTALFFIASRKWKLLSAGVIVICLIGVYRASYSTGTAIVLFGAFWAALFGLFKVKMKKRGWWMFVLAVLFVLLVSFPNCLSSFAPAVRHLGDSLEPVSNDYALRLHSVADAMTGYKDTYAVQRAELYWMSLNSWFEYPLLGFRWRQLLLNDGKHVPMGGHSYFFDSLAVGGLVLGLLLIAAVRNYFKYLRLLYARAGLPESCLGGWYCVFWMFAVCTTINQQGYFTVLIGVFFVVPSIPFLDYDHLAASRVICDRKEAHCE